MKYSTNLNRSKLLSRYDRLPFLSQTSSAVIKWSRPSTASHNHSFIQVFSHMLRNLQFLYNAFSRRPMFLYIEQEKKPIQHTPCTLNPHHVPTYSAKLLATHSIRIFPFTSPPTLRHRVPSGSERTIPAFISGKI